MGDGDKISVIIRDLGCTQEDFAVAVGVSRITINNIVNGHRPPSQKLIGRIFRILRVSEEWWREGDPTMMSPWKLLEDRQAALDAIGIAATLKDQDDPTGRGWEKEIREVSDDSESDGVVRYGYMSSFGKKKEGDSYERVACQSCLHIPHDILKIMGEPKMQTLVRLLYEYAHPPTQLPVGEERAEKKDRPG